MGARHLHMAHPCHRKHGSRTIAPPDFEGFDKTLLSLSSSFHQNILPAWFADFDTRCYVPTPAHRLSYSTKTNHRRQSEQSTASPITRNARSSIFGDWWSICDKQTGNG